MLQKESSSLTTPFTRTEQYRSILPAQVRRCGFTLVELLAVIGIVCVLLALGIPAISSVRKTQKSQECFSNLRQLFMAISLNAADNSGIYILGYEYGANMMWYESKSPLASYLGGPTKIQWLSVCPLSRKNPSQLRDTYGNPVRNDYGYPYVVNYNVLSNLPTDLRVRVVQVRAPAQTVMLADSIQGTGWGQGFSDPTYTSWSRIAEPHARRTNVLWCDGHASAETKEDIANRVSLEPK